MESVNTLDKIKEIRAGDIFTGELFIDKRNGGKIYTIRDFPYKEQIKPEVRTMMGWQDFSCLNFYELHDRKRYEFEVISIDENKNKLICRALEETLKEGFNYEEIDESDLREANKYDLRKGAIVIPSRAQGKLGEKIPLGVFFDPHYPNLTGFIHFNEELLVKKLIGKRIKVEVNKIEKGTKKDIIRTTFLKEL